MLTGVPSCPFGQPEWRSPAAAALPGMGESITHALVAAMLSAIKTTNPATTPTAIRADDRHARLEALSQAFPPEGWCGQEDSNLHWLPN
jgi:hypothetical protein